MSEWKEYKLGDIADIVSERISISKATLNNYISTENMKNDFGGVTKAEKLPVANTVNSFNKKDILFSNIRTYFKKVWLSKFNGTVSPDVLVFRARENKCTSTHLYYSLCSPDFTEYSVLTSKGAKMPRGDKDALRNFIILLPPLPEQTAIASVLSSLDDKIDLLHRQNATLEKMAETLFRKWFVEDAVFLETLADYVANANTGLDAIRRAPIVENETGIKCLRIQDVSQKKPIKNWGHSKVEDNNFNKFQLKRDDIIMARTCSPGINYFVREDLPAVFNNGLVRIRAKKEKVHPILLYYLFKTRDFIGHIDAISGGTSVQLNMQVGQLLSYEFSFPEIEKQNEIIGVFMDFDNKIFSNNNQIETLTKMRDNLLPKLMSGEVSVRTGKNEYLKTYDYSTTTCNYQNRRPALGQ